MSKLKGKVAVITGGTTGIGLATAQLFIAEGARVFITGRRQKELDDAINQLGPQAIGIRGDVSQSADLDALFERVAAEGRLDIVMANAGIGEMARLGDITAEQYERVFGVNVRGTLFTVQKALPLLNEGASIILTGSVAGVKGTPGFTLYGASKAAIRNMVRSWAAELKDRRIRANVLSPGPVDTAILDGIPADARTHLATTIPLGRLGHPDEVAKAALFLASDDSSFITGTELFVDGGRGQV